MFRFFEGLIDPYTPYKETDVPPTRLYPFLRAYAQPFMPVFYLTAAVSVVIAAVEIWLLGYLGRLVDMLTGTPEDVWLKNGTELILVAIFILTLRPAVHIFQVLLLNNTILPNFGTLVRWRAHRHVLRQSVGWFEDDFAGRIANRIMQTPPAAGEVVFQLFDAITFALAYVIGAAFLLGQADLWLMVPLAFWFIPYVFLLRWVVRRIGPASEASSNARSAITGRVVDSYTNIHSVKMFAHHDREVAYAKDAIEEARRTFQVEMRLYTIMDVALMTLNGLLIVGVVGWSLYLWMQGIASVGVVAVATSLALRLNAMSGWIMWAVSNFFRELGVVAEGMKTIAQPITLLDDADAPALQSGAGEVKVAELSHHYGKQSGGLDKINLTIAPGEKVGLVGQSGAGKSTLVKLLLRFYDAESGQIAIDGQDISSVHQESLRRVIGMVQQDSSLLHRSVRENILYGNSGASEDQMIAAARKAEAHDFILGLADAEGNTGYDARVGERGVKLSGGQRQRIALARVILKDAPILLLDEATSALDSEVEAAILQTLYGMMEGKTVIAIAHRLSTIAQMDRIIVMDHGRIIEDGTHEALLAAGGQYARFWARQSGGFLGEKEQDK
ncbi:multidrug ABC transporter ATP-binding protein [Loktanella sp. D2R18]|uniref:ABC transporter ATP-binding protein n=1 Tax=Rhodobacterales TaxID=204455 RepID=UPI000DE812B5|nr:MULTISPECIES: ABC transporter ATP-binding protein [Rhodobacterales]MDO6590435.1 ABC transporter ATP-binding protein [Yoonia sp. 1_MG-2023]RBW41158.1 multidrug ABC transporter ATP-binding protein [Loktanella sp. D2R18]